MTARTAWAFFIDVPNIGAEKLHWNALVNRLMKFPGDTGTVIHKRAYFQGKENPTSGFKEAYGILKRKGFNPYVTRSVHGRYPDVDGKIILDMAEIQRLISGGIYVFFQVNIVLLSSDGDYAEVLKTFDKEQTNIYTFGKTRLSNKLKSIAHASSMIFHFAPHVLPRKRKRRNQKWPRVA